MTARIYKPAKTAMQSGQANTREWVLEFLPSLARVKDPLMGWTGSRDTEAQVKMRFDTRAAAEAYAQRHGIPYTVFTPRERKPNVRPGGYGENFAWNRRQGWTH